MARLLIPKGSKYTGQTLEALPFTTSHTRILDVIRGETSVRRRRLKEITLETDDRLVLRTDTSDILGLKENGEVEFRDIADRSVEPVTAEPTLIMEARVGPISYLRGRALRDLRLQRRYGRYAMAVHRNDRNISDWIDDVRLQFADTLLLEGPAQGIQRLPRIAGSSTSLPHAPLALRTTLRAGRSRRAAATSTPTASP